MDPTFVVVGLVAAGTFLWLMAFSVGQIVRKDAGAKANASWATLFLLSPISGTFTFITHRNAPWVNKANKKYGLRENFGLVPGDIVKEDEVEDEVKLGRKFA